MSEPTTTNSPKPEVPGSIKSLNVLPHSGKVDQLRAEAAKATAATTTPPKPKKERPILPHVNRISASPRAEVGATARDRARGDQGVPQRL